MSDIYEFQFDTISKYHTINYFKPNLIINKCIHNRISSTILNQDNNVDKVINRLEKIIKYEETLLFLDAIKNQKKTKWHKKGKTLHLKL